METPEAINRLIEGVLNAQKKGAYNLEEAHLLYEAIEHITNTYNQSQQQQQEAQEQFDEGKSEQAQRSQQNIVGGDAGSGGMIDPTASS